MNISAITPSMVWAASSRSLTGFGSSALTSGSIAQTSVAAVTSVDLRPATGIMAMTTAGIVTGGGATGTVSVQVYDGTNSMSAATSGAGAGKSVGFTVFQTHPVGALVFNGDAAVAANYIIANILWTI